MTWTRDSGTAGDITGTWTAVDPTYNSYQLTINSNGSWSLVGNIISVGMGNPSARSQHWSNGYYVRPEYDDPNQTATSVAVIGPGITGSLSLAYDTNYKKWISWSLPGNPVYFGTTHPAAPLTYTFTITDASGAMIATATVGCFMEFFATNLSVAKDGAGNLVFSWTKVPYNNMSYRVELLNPNPSLPSIWNAYDLLDASSVTYTGPALTPGTTYSYDVGVSDSSGECASFTSASFTEEVFIDVPWGYWAYNYIMAIYNAHITTGCSQNPLKYCPEDNVSRGQMAAFIIRAKYGENFTYTQTPYFSDVPTTHVFFKYVQKLKDVGITAVSGTYDVDSYVTRGQMAAFIIRAKYGENFSYTLTPYFTDVPGTHNFFKYVQKMKDEGITAVTGTYGVDNIVTRAQMAAFLARAFLGMQ
jgi:hypothetical protein